jgi:hypothetical protein
MLGIQAFLRPPEVRPPRVALLLLATVLLAPACLAGETPAPPKPADLARLIDKVRQNETLFANLDATVRISCLFYPDPPAQRADLGVVADGFSLKSQEEVDRISTRGEQYFFSGEDTTSYTSGEKTTARRIATYDGSQTVAIEADNSATVYHTRYEPSQIFPPLSWGLFSQQVNFPLSVYLQGTAAIKAHPKPRRYPSEKGSVFEFYRVEVDQISEEKFNDLDCVKVELRRWSYTKDPPAIHNLWLAKDRNYHVAGCQVLTPTGKGKLERGDETRVRKWQEIAKGVWLPAEVTSDTFRWGPNGKKTTNLWFTRKLTLEKAAAGLSLPAESFTLPRIPGALPKFVIGTDGRLEDDPQHLAPAKANPDTTLESILTRLAAEEAKYDRLDIATTERYQQLDTSNQQGGLPATIDSTQRSVVEGNRLFFSEVQKSRSADGTITSGLEHQCYDGRCGREWSRYVTAREDRKVQDWARFYLSFPQYIGQVRAHYAVFNNFVAAQIGKSLTAYLRSGCVSKHDRVPLVITYVGDERAGGLYCHKLKCIESDPQVKGAKLESGWFLWLARDRNLIPVRLEWFESAWNAKLPSGIHYVENLREIRPGVWFPFRTVHLSFQRWFRGLCENRILLQWRREVNVTSLKVDAVVDESLFTSLEVPAGAEVSVCDEEGKVLAKYQQNEPGNLDVTPERVTQMREQAKKAQAAAKAQRAARAQRVKAEPSAEKK